ncbi:pirin family protein [Candidatus Pacearchaeota archaeon]|nr:pirin family protein [Candidatus Pacearchaeota archaeon]
MKLQIRRSEERGKTKLDWLDSRHGFSFGRYNNENNINFGKLVVFNDDIISPAKGFGAHPHEQMEIVTIVLEGELKHEDTLGNKGVIRKGELQRMSAGTGVFHSEFNASKEENAHILQIWIEPKSIEKPSYEDRKLNLEKNKLNLIVSGEKNKNMSYFNQDAYFLLGEFTENKKEVYKLKNKNNGVYIFVIEGKIEINGNSLRTEDSSTITEVEEITMQIDKNSKILLIEVPQ